MTVCRAFAVAIGAKRTYPFALHMSANDPKRTSGVRAGVVSNGIARPQLHPIQSRCPLLKEPFAVKNSCLEIPDLPHWLEWQDWADPRVTIGFMVRAGANAPDVSTPEAVKQALLKVDTLVFNNVATGNAFAKILERLGIADVLKDKIVRMGPEEVTMRILQGTGNELGVGPTPMILADNRLKLAGALPAELQSYILYAAAPMTNAQAPDAAKEFIRFLCRRRPKHSLPRPSELDWLDPSAPRIALCPLL